MTPKQEMRFKAELRKFKKANEKLRDVEVPQSPEYLFHDGFTRAIDQVFKIFRQSKKRRSS